MENKVDMQCNKVFHLEDSMIMFRIYNSDTLEKLIETVHRMHNTTSWHERVFAGKLNHWFEWYLSKDGVGHYAIHATIRENYVRMYEWFIEQLKMYCCVILFRIIGNNIGYNINSNWYEISLYIFITSSYPSNIST